MSKLRSMRTTNGLFLLVLVGLFSILAWHHKVWGDQTASMNWVVRPVARIFQLLSRSNDQAPSKSSDFELGNSRKSDSKPRKYHFCHCSEYRSDLSICSNRVLDLWRWHKFGCRKDKPFQQNICTNLLVFLHLDKKSLGFSQLLLKTQDHKQGYLCW